MTHLRAKQDIAKAIAYNAGNKAYDQHYWEDVIGPLPDMGKGLGTSATYKPPAHTSAPEMMEVRVEGGAPVSHGMVR